MKLKLVAAISVLAAIPALAHAQQGGPRPNVPKLRDATCDRIAVGSPTRTGAVFAAMTGEAEEDWGL